MSTETPKQTPYARREFLQAVAKRSAVLAGLIAAAHLPYKKPNVTSFFGVKNAYAQATPGLTYTITMSRNFDGVPGTSWNTGQDAYYFNCPAGVTLTIAVTVDSYLWPEIGLYAPGTDPGTGTNLLTGGANGLASAGVGSGINTNYGPTPASGDYTIAIEDERVNANEQAGLYSIQITTTQPLGAPVVRWTAGAETMDPDT